MVGSGNTTSYLLDKTTPARVTNSSGTTDYMIFPSTNEQFSITSSSGTFVPLRDRLGSTVAWVNNSGALATQCSYEPYGATNGNQPACEFTGQEIDSGPSLNHFPFRYFSPRLQRFVSEDLLGVSGGSTNLFKYAGNSPVNFVDPLGLSIAGQVGSDLTAPLSASDAGAAGGVVGGAFGAAGVPAAAASGFFGATLATAVAEDVWIAAGVVVVGTLTGTVVGICRGSDCVRSC